MVYERGIDVNKRGEMEFVVPEHIQEIAVSVIAHRMLMDPQARFSGRTAQGVIEEILKTTPVPA